MGSSFGVWTSWETASNKFLPSPKKIHPTTKITEAFAWQTALVLASEAAVHDGHAVDPGVLSATISACAAAGRCAVSFDRADDVEERGCRFVPKKICSNTIRHRWYLPPDLNIGVSTRVWRLDSGPNLQTSGL